jgi:hypothetical protein
LASTGLLILMPTNVSGKSSVAIDFTFSGIVVLVGAYGSGKTEVAINLAAVQKKQGRHVQIADLDLVNLYFRTRQARETLSRLGIHMALPPGELLNADLPVLTPEIMGIIRRPGDLAVLDVGGDKVGAAVLSALAEGFQRTTHPVHVWQVVNPHRPDTRSAAQCLNMRSAIEATSRLRISGWVGNANLMGDTTVDHILQGYETMTDLSETSGLPLVFITTAQELLSGLDVSHFACPVLPIRRQLVPPWESAQRLE